MMNLSEIYKQKHTLNMCKEKYACMSYSYDLFSAVSNRLVHHVKKRCYCIFVRYTLHIFRCITNFLRWFVSYVCNYLCLL